MSDVSYAGPLNQWLAQAPPQPPPLTVYSPQNDRGLAALGTMRRGQDAYASLAALRGNKGNFEAHDVTSGALREAGIPGIKYLDQGSRGKGDGTRNYVVFDDKPIDILKKYGIAGIGALPAMNAYHYQDKGN